MSVRSELRATVFEWAQNQCEHPSQLLQEVHVFPDDYPNYVEPPPLRCPFPATELAHIKPRGMGHKGDRDVIGNVIAACTLHARSTDDLSSPEWRHVPAPHDRIALTEWVRQRRLEDGWPAELGVG